MLYHCPFQIVQFQYFKAHYSLHRLLGLLRLAQFRHPAPQSKSLDLPLLQKQLLILHLLLQLTDPLHALSFYLRQADLYRTSYYIPNQANYCTGFAFFAMGPLRIRFVRGRPDCFRRKGGLVLSSPEKSWIEIGGKEWLYVFRYALVEYVFKKRREVGLQPYTLQQRFHELQGD